MATSREPIAVYLRDHHAVSAGGRALARRAFRQNRGSRYESGLASLLREIDDEQRQLLAVMRAARVTPSPIKRVAAVSAERLGRLKLNGSLSGYSATSRVVELEMLHSAVDGKLRLWTAVRRIVDGANLTVDVDLDGLERTARAQLEMLAELHGLACDEAF